MVVKETLYTQVSWDHLPGLGEFLYLMCLTLVHQWEESVSMGTITHQKGKNTSSIIRVQCVYMYNVHVHEKNQDGARYMHVYVRIVWTATVSILLVLISRDYA